MLKQLDDYNWAQAFQCAGEINNESQNNDADVREAIPGSNVSLHPFCREDVKEIFAMDEGERDESNWICFGKLNDKRYFFLSAGCDYTGWDCRSGGCAIVSNSKKELVKFGICENERQRLKL